MFSSRFGIKYLHFAYRGSMSCKWLKAKILTNVLRTYQQVRRTPFSPGQDHILGCPFCCKSRSSKALKLVVFIPLKEHFVSKALPEFALFSKLSVEPLLRHRIKQRARWQVNASLQSRSQSPRSPWPHYVYRVPTMDKESAGFGGINLRAQRTSCRNVATIKISSLSFG